MYDGGFPVLGWVGILVAVAVAAVIAVAALLARLRR